MLGLGVASSHAPAMFEQGDRWPMVYDRIPDYTKNTQPATALLETPEVIDGYVRRIEAGFSTLRAQVEAYQPDALLVVGDDQGDVYDETCNPAFALFTGEAFWGLDKTWYWPLEERRRLEFRGHPELANVLAKELVKRGFDLAISSRFSPIGRPEYGMGHMVVNPVPKLTPALDVPVIPLFVNAYYPPQPTARRCFELGRALAEILAPRPERVVIVASGGLSHDPAGPRAGWVDKPLDEWFLQRLERADMEPLQHMFTFDSDTLRGGTGEIRAWIVAAAAMDRPATIVDYIPAHHAKTGLGFAFWPPLDEPSAPRRLLAEAGVSHRAI